MCHTVAMDAPTPLPDSPLAVPEPRERSAWDAWGTETARLPPGAKTLVGTVLSGRPHPIPRRVPPSPGRSRLDDQDLEALSAAVSPGAVAVDDPSRILHLGGKSTPDLLARRLEETPA